MTQFPNASDRVRRVRGFNSHVESSGRGRFNERDAAAVAATTVNMQPAILVFAAAIDQLSHSVGGQMQAGSPSLTMTFAGAWLMQTALVAGLKAVACLLRSRGESLFRDIIAWLWFVVIDSAWRAVKAYFFGGVLRWFWSLGGGLWPFGRARKRRWGIPSNPHRPVPPNGPSPGRRPFREEIQRRRSTRRERWGL